MVIANKLINVKSPTEVATPLEVVTLSAISRASTVLAVLHVLS